MKTREQILQEVKNLNKKHLLLALPTGLGKSALALHLALDGTQAPKVLIVYPQTILKKNWKDEIIKWGYESHLKSDIQFTTYKSLHKYADVAWDAVIFDEGHHITERVLEIISSMTINHAYILSATVKPAIRYRLEIAFPGLYSYRMTMHEAIDSDILPEPTIIKIPLQLSTIGETENIIKNPKATHTILVPYSKRFGCNDKKVRYLIPCTQAQYYMDLCAQVDFYDRKFKSTGMKAMEHLKLNKAGERLKWLASKKTDFVVGLLSKLKNERVLSFCGSVDQTELLGAHCIHHKQKKKSQVILDEFNEGKIKHITAVAMLDEGQNLVNCRIGVFVNINASDRMQIQRTGRILRHKNPIIIIPYYVHTREEEIVDGMLQGYKPELIKTITNLNELPL